MNVVTPMNSTTGRITRAKSANSSPNEVAWATSASATIAPDSADRNIPALVKDSFQASARVASKPQCSVASTWSRSATGDPAPVSPMAGGAGSAAIGPGMRSSDMADPPSVPIARGELPIRPRHGASYGQGRTGGPGSRDAGARDMGTDENK